MASLCLSHLHTTYMRLCPYVRIFSHSRHCNYGRLEGDILIGIKSQHPPRGRRSDQRYSCGLTDSLNVRVFLCCCGQRSDLGRNGDRSRYVAGSNRSQLLPSISIPLPPAPGPVEGGKMGGGGGHEQHTSSAPGLHGGGLPVSDTGIHVQQASPHWEVWVWQGVSSQVERRLCHECGGQRDSGYGHCWDLLIAGVVCSGVGATADGRRCGEKPWPHR